MGNKKNEKCTTNNHLRTGVLSSVEYTIDGQVYVLKVNTEQVVLDEDATDKVGCRFGKREHCVWKC